MCMSYEQFKTRVYLTYNLENRHKHQKMFQRGRALIRPFELMNMKGDKRL